MHLDLNLNRPIVHADLSPFPKSFVYLFSDLLFHSSQPPHRQSQLSSLAILFPQRQRCSRWNQNCSHCRETCPKSRRCLEAFWARFKAADLYWSTKISSNVHVYCEVYISMVKSIYTSTLYCTQVIVVLPCTFRMYKMCLLKFSVSCFIFPLPACCSQPSCQFVSVRGVVYFLYFLFESTHWMKFRRTLAIKIYSLNNIDFLWIHYIDFSSSLSILCVIEIKWKVKIGLETETSRGPWEWWVEQQQQLQLFMPRHESTSL